jgi:hypothetical protein
MSISENKRKSTQILKSTPFANLFVLTLLMLVMYGIAVKAFSMLDTPPTIITYLSSQTSSKSIVNIDNKLNVLDR